MPWSLLIKYPCVGRESGTGRTVHERGTYKHTHVNLSLSLSLAHTQTQTHTHTHTHTQIHREGGELSKTHSLHERISRGGKRTNMTHLNELDHFHAHIQGDGDQIVQQNEKSEKSSGSSSRGVNVLSMEQIPCLVLL